MNLLALSKLFSDLHYLYIIQKFDVWTQGLLSSHRHNRGPQIEVQQVQFAFCSVFVLHLLLNENILLFSR